MEKEITEVVTRKVEVYPCIKCGSENIEIYNCGYSSFNCAGGKCKRCGYKVETYEDWNVKNSTLIKAWNLENDPSVLIERLNNERHRISEEIKVLTKVYKKRLKNKNK